MSLATGLILAATLVANAPAGTADAAENVAQINALEHRQATSWNAHDAHAYAQLYTRDADVVNVVGWHWRGRDELERKLGRGFGFIFARSRLTIGEISVRFLKPDVAVVHVQWTMTGALGPTGGAAPPQRGIQTQVLLKQGGVWRIDAFQNTNAAPEQPFPLPN